jgi:ABC-type nitrate/sulfonate/bicarbonate transport system substrate-binding protein
MGIEMHRFLTSVAAGILAAAMFVGGAEAQQKVRLAYANQIHQANMMQIAEYAKKQGVDLEASILSHYTNLQIALTTNQMDFVVMGYSNLGLMEDMGFKNYRVIAGVFTGAQSLTLRNGVTAASWKDLEGKKIGSAPNSYADILFKTSAKLGGADLSKIHMVNFAPSPAVTAALASGDIDGFVFWEPFNANAAVKKIGTYSTLDLGANPTKHINAALYVNREFAEKHKDTVTAVVKALVESTDALNADAALFNQVVAKGTRASPEEIAVAIPHGKLDYRLYQKEAKALLHLISEAGITKGDRSGEVDNVFDYSYLMAATKKAKRDLGGE